MVIFGNFYDFFSSFGEFLFQNMGICDRIFCLKISFAKWQKLATKKITAPAYNLK
jgi:hypothetical protein